MKGELGFTGTRNEPSKAQRNWLLQHMLESVVENNEVKRVHHGCCIGADAYFHKVCKSVYGDGLEEIVLHPPTDRSREMEADEWTIRNCIWYPRKPYLLRNQDIAHSCSRLVALPDRPETTRGSGTWHTIHAALESGRHALICYPDRTVDYREPGRVKNLKKKRQ